MLIDAAWSFTRRTLVAVPCATLLVVSLWGIHANAEPSSEERTTLVVATKQAPPLAMKDLAGNWSGLSIRLWTDIAKELDVDFVLQEFSLKRMLRVTEQSKVDLAVAAISITPEREARMDFSRPYHYAGLGIAAHKREKQSEVMSVLLAVLANVVFQGVVTFFLAIVLLGTAIPLLNRAVVIGGGGGNERLRVGDSAIDSGVSGLRSAVRWMTASWFGVAMVVVWWGALFFGISTVSSNVSHALLVVDGFEDLRASRVGVVEKSSAEGYLHSRGLSTLPCRDLGECLTRLSKREIGAVVSDYPLLQYRIAREYPQALRAILTNEFRQSYGIALPSDSPWRRPINRAISKLLSEEAYMDELKRVFIEPENSSQDTGAAAFMARGALLQTRLDLGIEPGDRDEDGILDVDDGCPDLVGGHPGGCPETVYVRVAGLLLHLTTPVTFEAGTAEPTGQDTIGVLDQVAALLEVNPDYRLGIYWQGRDDDTGGRRLGLGRERVDAVHKALVARGLPPERAEVVASPLPVGLRRRLAMAGQEIVFGIRVH